MKTTKKNKLIKLLVLFSAYSISLVIFRIWFTHSLYYSFLIWNLFLAYIPFLISQSMFTLKLSRLSFLIVFVLWLLFLPNAPYIITDIFHLSKQTTAPVWFDLLLVFSFAINGVILFFISTYKMHKIILEKTSKRIAWIISTIIMFLSGFGIYLGRFLRFNSWDIISNPKILFVDILDRFINPTAHPKTWGVTLGFGLFLFFGFLFLNTLAPNHDTISKNQYLK